MKEAAVGTPKNEAGSPLTQAAAQDLADGIATRGSAKNGSSPGAKIPTLIAVRAYFDGKEMAARARSVYVSTAGSLILL